MNSAHPVATVANHLASNVDWSFVLDAAQFTLYVLLGLFLWISNGKKATHDSIEQLEDKVDKRFDEHSRRITTVEETQKHSPNADSIEKLHKRMNDVQKTVSKQEGQLDGMGKTLDLIHRSLLEKDT